MFEITHDHIQQLNDVDLRALIGHLCEADLNSKGISTSCATWGGAQTAADGGLDVRVNIKNEHIDEGFIPKLQTGFQVKKHDLAPSAIEAEMCPKGKLRTCVIELAQDYGAYIIVCGKTNASDTMLKNRINAMDAAVKTKMPEHNLTLDYYDSGRIATWVRNYPALIIWVRDKIGEAISGWKPYENWSNVFGGVEEPYLIDDKVRMYYNGNQESNIIEGLNRMRKILLKPRTSVRLAGLSGVGKTRFAQALFDNRLVPDALSPSLVIYTDIGLEPSPTPYAFAEQLVALKQRVVLIIDNCTPEMHQKLTDICKQEHSCISLLTIEYDIKDEQTRETETFSMEPASDTLITKLVQLRFPHIVQAGAQVISDFSGGNARIAIALAGTVQTGDNLLSLNDSVLFDRLFWQREAKNENLRKVAEVCSLVYSFDSDVNDNPEDEIEVLSSLINMDSADFYRYTSILLDRDMMQKRSRWRAILPHAIANKLASQALKNIPVSRILKAFSGESQKRLLQSFAHRLSYLHHSEEARSVAKSWISEGGILADICNLDYAGHSMLRYIASTIPSIILDKYIQTILTRPTELFDDALLDSHMGIIAKLAYEESTFSDCADILTKCVLYKREKLPHYSNHHLLISLFYLYYSGTSASPTQKLDYMKTLIMSGQEARIKLGLEMLGAALSTNYHPYTHDFSFGSHNRDGGYKPQNDDEYIAWYQKFIDLSVELILREDEIGHRVQKILSDKIRELCRSDLYPEVLNASKQIRLRVFWPLGFVRIHDTIKYDRKRMTKEILAELNKIKNILAPASYEEKAILLVSTHYGDHRSLYGKKLSYEQAPKIAEELGRKISAQVSSLLKVTYVSAKESNWLAFYIGRGIASKSKNHRDTWGSMTSVYHDLPQTQRNYSILCGFLQILHEINPSLCNSILDEVSNDPRLMNAYFKLQSSFEIDEAGVKRIKDAISSDSLNIWSCSDISNDRSFASHNLEAFEDILLLITRKPKGDRVAIEIFAHSFYDEITKGVLSDEQRRLGRKLLLLFDFAAEPYSNSSEVHDLTKVFSGCFSDDVESKNDLIALIERFCQAGIHGYRSVREYDGFARKLIKKHPLEFLDVSLCDDIEPDWYFLKHIGDRLSDTSTINSLDSRIIIGWCQINPELRYPRISKLITPFEYIDNICSWTALAKHIITSLENPIAILDIFYDSLWPMSWSGSRALIVEPRVKLIEELCLSNNAAIKKWATDIIPTMLTRINETRIWEESRNRNEERFE